MPPTLPTSDDALNENQENEEQHNSAVEPNPQFLFADTDDDEEENNHLGYQMLSPNGEEAAWVNDDDDSDEDNQESEPVLQPMCEDAHISDELQEGGNFEIEMDSEHIEKIKNVMRNVTIPHCNMPPWTEAVPEEEWTSVLMQKIDARVSKGSVKNGNVDSPAANACKNDVNTSGASSNSSTFRNATNISGSNSNCAKEK